MNHSALFLRDGRGGIAIHAQITATAKAQYAVAKTHSGKS
jgi:hypothetical protein